MKADCRTELREQGEAVLADAPGLLHEWAESADLLALRFPATDPGGFNIGLAARDADIELTAGRFHSHFDDSPDPTILVRSAFAVVRDLLSPSMRLRELRAGGMPDRGFMESWQDDSWQVEEETGLLIWNFFGRRTEKVYQNRQLPAR